MSEIRPIRWADGRLHLLDQTLLPAEEAEVTVTRYEEAVDAIREMRVRGAPAIGVTAAYAMAMAARDLADGKETEFQTLLEEAATSIRAARPTAVNLGWAVDRMLTVVASGGTPKEIAGRLLAEAEEIQQEDEAINRRMGEFGKELMPDGGSVLTHCNTGSSGDVGFRNRSGGDSRRVGIREALRGLQHRDPSRGCKARG